MVLKSRLLFLAVMMIIISGMGFYSAADFQDNQTISAGADSIEHQVTVVKHSDDYVMPESNENIKHIKKVEHTDVKEAYEGEVASYEDLYDLLSTSSDDSISVSLMGDDDYVVTDSIVLSSAVKNLVIEGNGKTIDGRGQKEFLTVNHPANITLNNITLTSCNVTADNSAAITVHDSNITVNNSVFSGNVCPDAEDIPDFKDFAGIFYVKNSNMVIDNTLFEDNDACNSREILFNSTYNNMTILNTIFMKNGVMEDIYPNTDSSMVIRTNGIFLIRNSTFSLNNNSNALVVFYGDEESYVEVSNSTFYDNEDLNSLLYFDSNGTVLVNNTNFTYNTGSDGGAIFFTGNNNSKLSIMDSIFDRNGQEMNENYGAIGGALYIVNNGTCYLTNNTFNSNYAFAQGGAVYYEGGNQSYLELRDSIFDSNGISDSPDPTASAGAIYMNTMGNVTLDHNEFLSNRAASGAAALMYYGNMENWINISNSIFDSNKLNEYGYGGSISIVQAGNVTLDNVTVSNSFAYTIGAIDIGSVDNVTMNGCKFYNNTAVGEYGTTFINTEGDMVINECDFIDNSGGHFGVLYLDVSGNLSIINSNFKSNLAPSWGLGYVNVREGNMILDNDTFDSNGGEETNNGALLYLSSNNGNISINNTVFSNNSVSPSGTLSLEGNANASITYTNFTNNYFTSMAYQGVLVNNMDLTLNHTNFIGHEVTNSYSQATCINNYKSLIIDNSNFTNNIGKYYGIISHFGNTLSINHSLFRDNSIKQYSGQIMAGIIYIEGINTSIDNSLFIRSYANANYVFGTVIRNNGPINVTNNIFSDNHPLNFVVKDGIIQVDQSNIGYRDDGYIPSDANVTIYVNNNTEGIKRQMIDHIITDFTVDEDDYLYRIVVDGPDDESYINDHGYTYHNTYYIIMNHEIFLTLDTNTSVKYGENINITGKLYHINSQGEEVYYSDYIIELYVNETLITTDTTDDNGEYSFTYPAEVIGTHNILVKFPGNIYQGQITNNTTFTVNKIYTKLSIEAQNTTYGTNYVIIGRLTDIEDNPIEKANITIYVDNIPYEIEVQDGNILYENVSLLVGENHIYAIFNGNYSHNGSFNITSFNVSGFNTRITVNATNTTMNNQTSIAIKLTDDNNKNITDAPVLIYINYEELTGYKTDQNGEINFNYTTTLPYINYVEVFYKGNNTYTASINHTIFNVNRKQTNITVTQTSSKPGNLTYNVTIVDEKENPITEGTIIIYDENGDTIITKNIKESETEITIKDITNGRYTFNITYPGNDTYMPSSKSVEAIIMPEAQIRIEVTNNTEKNLQLTITVTDDTQTPKTEQEVNITLPNGTKITRYTDQEGKIQLTDTTVTVGEQTITAEIKDTPEMIGTTETKTITVEPDYPKIIKEMNETIQELNNTIDKLNDNITSLEGNLTEALNNITQLKEDLEHNISALEDAYVMIDELNSNVTQLREDLANNISALEDAYVMISELNNNIAQLQEDLANNISALREALEENQQLQEKLIEAQEKIGNLTTELNEAKDEINNLKDNLTEAQNTINNLNNTVNNLTQQLEAAKDTINTLNQSLIESEQKIVNLTKELEVSYQKIENLTQQLEDSNNKNKELTQQLEEAKQEIKNLEEQLTEAKKEITELNNTVNNLEKQVQQLEDEINLLNKTSVITVVPTNSTIGDSKVIVTLDNKLGNPISNASITVQNSEGKTIGTGKTDDKGIVIIPADTKSGTENITVIYAGDNNYKGVNTTVSITTDKLDVTIKVDPVTGIIGEDITLTAHLNDINGNPVSGGNLVFKLNGKTLRTDGRFDSNATAWKFKVTNGLVSVTIKADLYLRNVKNLTASYSGSNNYNEAKSDVVTAQIKKRNATLNLTLTPQVQKHYNNILFMAKLTDITQKYKNRTAINTDTQVFFKINGKTLKDDKCNVILVNITNETATYNYTVPASMGGINSNGQIRNNTVEAVMLSDTYYPNIRNKTIFNVELSPVTLEFSRVTVNNNNQLSIKANIRDYKGNNVIGVNTVNIKINGKSYVNPNTNKTENFKITNGIINLNNIQVSEDITIKRVMLVTGLRQAYLDQRNETANIVKA